MRSEPAVRYRTGSIPALVLAIGLAWPAMAKAQFRWAEETPPTPTARALHGTVYDSARGRLVLFGGADNFFSGLDDTWEHDGSEWVEVIPEGDPDSPDPRDSPSLVYDSGRGRVVLFGGFIESFGPDHDTWEYDGSAWTEVDPVDSPPARYGHSAAYDAARQRTVLFGGADDLDAAINDTWEWNGVDWTQITTDGAEGSPPPRAYSALAYDATRQRVVLFGGFDSDGELNDTWEFDGVSWTEITTDGDPTAPPPRGVHGMTYDPTRQRVVLFGGFDGDGELEDTWEFDGVSWTERTDEVAPGPPPTAGFQLAYDTVAEQAIFFGGGVLEGGFVNDTWAFGDTGWANRSASPGMRTRTAMAYDSARERLVVFGGELTDSIILNDTWEWDGSSWTIRTADGASGAPPARASPALAYDSARRRLVLFGGEDADGDDLNDTWEWDGTVWTEVTSQGDPDAPSPRDDHSIAFDASRQRVVLFGGNDDAGEELNDTWEYDGTSWTEILPDGDLGSPGRRDEHRIAYDAARERVVLFGGELPSGDELNDTWAYDGTSWIEIFPDGDPGSPPARNDHGIAHDAARREIVIFGGSGDLDDTWAFDGVTWTELTTLAAPGSPSGRDRLSMAYHAARGRSVIFGGDDDFFIPLNDTWTLATTTATIDAFRTDTTTSLVTLRQTGLVVEARVSNAGIGDAEISTATLRFVCAFESDATSGYDVSAPVSLPSTLAGGESITLTFSVDVSDSAILGLTTIHAVVDAVDASSGEATSDATAELAAAWNVIFPAELSIAGFDGPALASRGTTFAATVSVENIGESTAAISAAELDWDNPGISAVASPANTSTLAPGELADLAFEVSVSLTAPLSASSETFSADATITAADVLSGVPASVEAPGAGSVDVENHPPTARAGPERVGTSVQTASFDGRGSFDGPEPSRSEGDPLVYTWRLLNSPADSALTSADLQPNSSSAAAVTSLTPDLKGVYLVGLTVDDGLDASEESNTRLLVVNTSPVARARIVASPVPIFSAAVLDGTSTTDVDAEDTLSYLWELEARPVSSSSSSADIGLASSATASFIPDAPGEYRFRLTVEDGDNGISIEEATLTATNSPPAAVAAASPTAVLDSDVTLDGTGSTDPETPDLLTFTWSFRSVPPGSALTGGDIFPNGVADAATAAFRPDLRGTYDVDLVVSDGFEASAPATVRIVVENREPSAIIAPIASVDLGETVSLDGSGSSDPDGDTLEFSWRFTSIPPGSVLTTAAFAVNDSTAAASTSFTPDATGAYGIALTVDDGFGGTASSSAQSAVGFEPPRAIASAPTTATVTAAVVLDGSASVSPAGRPLVYRWDFLSQPPGSALTAGDIAPNDSADAATASFTAVRKGEHVVRLIVADGPFESTADAVSVTVVNSQPSVSISAVSTSTTGSATVLAATGEDPNDEDVLIYTWSALEAPTGVAPEALVFQPNASAAAATAAVTLEAAGSYRFRVSVSDGDGGNASDESVAVIEAAAAPAPPNEPPVARIEAASSVGGARLLVLDGSGSSDPEGDELAYAWTLSERPEGAASFISSEASISYAASLAGRYTFLLSVFDSRLAAGSTSATLVVDLVRPVADARGDREAVLTRPGSEATVPTTLAVSLDGTASTDDNTASLTYLWETLEAPDLSTGASAPSTLVTLLDATTPRARARFADTLRAASPPAPMDAAGSYRFRLTVSDGAATDSDTVSVVAIDPLNLLPRADAGLDRNVSVRFLPGGGLAPTIPDPTVFPPVDAAGNPVNLTDLVRLDGRESSDPQGRPLTYSWTMISAPPGAAAGTLQESGTPFPFFRPGVEGTYAFSLAVSNGLHRSAPDDVRIAISAANSPPTALAFVEDLIRIRRSSPTRPLLAFRAGERVVLDGSTSTDPDLSDRDSLRYGWRQLAGSRATLEPSTSAPTVSFVPERAARLAFELTVTDAKGAADTRELEVAVLPASTASVDTGLPLLSIVASASTTSATGADFEAGAVRLGPSSSLRVTAPTTVTLTGRLTRPSTPPVPAVDFLWFQLAGPPVLLSNTEDLNTAASTSVTSFSPTTSRVHVFAFSAFVLDSSGARTGLFVTRQVRVIVDTSFSSVPESNPLANPSTIFLSGAESGRTVTLDGSGAGRVGALAGTAARLLYTWRQFDGPAGTIANPFALKTTFTAPEFPGGTQPYEYLFELTVDVSPPGDRSEPGYTRVQQSAGAGPSPAPSPAAFSGPAGGGGGCSLSADASLGIPALPVLLGLAWSLACARARQRRARDSIRR